MLKSSFPFILMTLLNGYAYSQTSPLWKTQFDSIANEFGRGIQKDNQADLLGESISIAIVHQNKILWSKAFGYLDKEKKIRADSLTIYRTGSISKSITAFLLMELVQKGLLKLQDPVENYLPEIRGLKGFNARRKITFFELATHTSGLEAEPELSDAASGPIENWEKKVLEAIPATSIKKKPGKTYSYSNIGYAILGLALERAAAKPFIRLIEENIFIPLAMTNSYFAVPNEKITQLASGISRINSRTIDLETPRSENLGRGYKIPNGGIYSTPDDLSRFVMANLGYDSLLKAENREFMQTGKVWTSTFLRRLSFGIISLISGK